MSLSALRLLEPEDIRACLAYAHGVLADDSVS